MHIFKGMSSYVVSGLGDADVWNMSCLQAVDMIRFVFRPAYIETGNCGGDWFKKCIECVASWDEDMFADEVRSIKREFTNVESFMVGALHSKARSTGYTFHMTSDFTANTLVCDIVKGLLHGAATEQIVLSGKFFTHTIAASDVSKRLMGVVMEMMLARWVIFHPRVIPDESKHASTVVSTGVQTVVLPDVPTVPAQSVGSGSDVESAVDDIHPHDSVSMAGAPRFEPPPRFEPHRMRPDLPPLEFSRRDEVSFDELVEQFRKR